MTVFELLPFFHTWKNPHILSLRDPETWVAYEQFIPMDRFKQFQGNPNYKNLSKLEVWTGDIESQEEQEIRAFREKQPLRKGDQIMHSELVKLTFYWSYNDFVILANDDTLIRHDKQNFLGKIPIKAITPIPQDNEFWGMSILEEGKGLFAEADENRNQFNDAANMMLSPQYIVDRDRANLKRRTIEAKTGNIIWVDDVTAIVPQKQDWQLLNMALKRQQFIYEDIMNYSNAFLRCVGNSRGELRLPRNTWA